MISSICVIGALRATFDPTSGFDGERRPAGIGVLLSVALARMGAEVIFVAGTDDGACTPSSRAPLVAEGIDVRPFRLGPAPSVPPGEDPPEALPDLETVLRDLPATDRWLVQLELPDEPLTRVLTAGRERGQPVIVHALPARELEAEALAGVELLIATTDDALTLTRMQGEKVSRKGLARRLSALGPGRIVVTSIGGRALSFDGKTFHEVELGEIEGARGGLAAQFLFSAAYSFALLRGKNCERSLHFAARVVALPATETGDFPTLPGAKELELLDAEG